MWEETININAVTEIRCKTTNYFGVNAITKIQDISAELKKQGISKVIVVTGKMAYKKSGAWDHVEKAFKSNGISYDIYNEVTPNPEVDQVDNAVTFGKKLGAQAVLGIGGGSPIDAAKSVAILLAYPDKNARDLFEFKFTPEKALPLIAINLTHGTGTEVNRFAVISIPEKEYKPAIAYDCIYPLFSIDDPALMTGLSADQTRFVSIDAINHVVEAATTKTATPYSIILAKETIRLVAKYLPLAEKNPNDLKARYFLAYASVFGGIAFDNGLLHFTHALEHPLSGVNSDVVHGHGLALLLPAVVKQIYPSKGKVLADIISPIVPGLTGASDEGEIAANGIRSWLERSNVPSGLKSLGFNESDIAKLTELALNTPSLGLLLSLAPIDSGKAVIETIYRDSM
jgi:alcohol dehydrogenase class IV